MLTHMLLQTPAREPMKSIMDRVMNAEAQEQVLNASVFGGFSLADIPEACLGIVVVEQRSNGVATGINARIRYQRLEYREGFVW